MSNRIPVNAVWNYLGMFDYIVKASLIRLPSSWGELTWGKCGFGKLKT